MSEQEGQVATIEDQAREMGWRPREEFDDSSGKEWVSAEIFVARKPLIERIEKQSRELRDLKTGLEEFKKIHNKVAETEYNRALADLKRQRKEALAEEDAEKALDVNNQIVEMQKSGPPRQETSQKGDPAVYQAWLAKNTWYTNDATLQAKANVLSRAYIGTMSPEDILDQVTQDIKAMYPEKFRNTNRNKASAVETKTNQASPSKKSEVVLDDATRQIAYTLIRAGAYKDMAAYMEAYKKLNGDEE